LPLGVGERHLQQALRQLALFGLPARAAP